MNQRAIIIGASSGIGMALAKVLVKNSYVVGITGRRQEKLLSLSKDHPGQMIVSAFDCANDNNHEILDGLVNEMGSLDLLVFSSGYGEINPELKPEIEQASNKLNVHAFTEIINWCYLYFKKEGKGHIAVVTSIAGLRGGDASPAYNASKAYQINYLEGIRKKLRQKNKNIHVLDIRPGYVDTAMAKGEGQFWVSSKEKAAKQIFSAIEYKKDVAYISRRWRVISTILKFVPRKLYLRI